MDRFELSKQVDRLYDNYSISASPKIREDKVSFLFRELEHTKTQYFIKATHRILRDESIRTFPSLAQIKNYMVISSDVESQQKFCKQCEESGYYTTWQLRDAQWYSFAFRCACNTSQSLSMTIADPGAIPVRAHNSFPPSDQRHAAFNLRKAVI